MALSEALRKLYGSLYLGSPGGMEAWRERNPPRPHTPPPPLLESRVVPRWVQWRLSCSPKVRSSLG